ncbi:BTAD domain-containing putative transcriptional regulator [Streptomyces sp. BK239]|uniref:AfsR/SARP family transcriptional regulator n=1 Tax=Streptomyces sp. BK239 TaxID=2512155 RepID=UPI0010E3D28A|nr:BTAD domain-containing putative transcriptional regulator [Streptomyces sp. BK239]RZU18001.1 DNA-binding SARP family transcriptional activator [Streptomyces sp. BK239]
MPADPREELRFELLGPVRVMRADRELGLGFPQQRALLALLLAHAGRTVPTSEILDVLWAERPPASAPNVVRRYAAALRRLLEPESPRRAPGGRLLRRPGGYLLQAAQDEVDLLRFRELTRQGKRAAATGRPETAAGRFTEALREWRGPVIAMGIPQRAREHVQFTAVEHELLHTAVLAADAALRCGRADQVLPALRRATALAPLDEPLHARLILSLAACGLQADALAAYDEVRRRLTADLGVSPGPELAAAHTSVLRQEAGRLRSGPTVRLDRAAPVVHLRTSPDPRASARLPLETQEFAGRKAELDWLAARSAEPGPTVLAVVGMAGVGKSALAVHWAHRTAGRYPDGLLYVPLRGTDPARPALDPSEGLRTMLTALGVPASQVPEGRAARAGLYRTLLADRRVLVVLDDAAGTEQTGPLLPGSPGCLTLVTSRDALPGLIASGARPLRLEPPTAADAREILTRRLGAGRVAAEPAAVDEITARCGRLPLALTAVAERLRRQPETTLAALAAQLRAHESDLDAFDDVTGATPDVRTAFLASSRRLSPQGERLFRLLPRHPGPDLTATAAAHLAGLPLRRARILLGELADAHLVTEHAPARYTLHPLLRAHANELASTDGLFGPY